MTQKNGSRGLIKSFRNLKGKRGGLAYLYKLLAMPQGVEHKPDSLGFRVGSKCKGGLDRCRILCKRPTTLQLWLVMEPWAKKGIARTLGSRGHLSGIVKLTQHLFPSPSFEQWKG